MGKTVILSATNRVNSNTLKVSRIYERILKDMAQEALLLDFRVLPPDITEAEAFGRQTEPYAALVKAFVSANDRFIFIVPEYNGSFPGILKTFLDSMHPREWAGKKACLVGVSDGRAGNLRGMDHLTGILQYLKMHVYHNKLPISLINKVFDADGNMQPEQLKVCALQVEGFMSF